MLASSEGIFGEPASAASIAGLAKYAANHPEMADRRVVCIITGNGLKDPESAASGRDMEFDEVPADIDAVRTIPWTGNDQTRRALH